MTDKMASEIDVSAILSTYVYMDHQSEAYQNRKLSDILEDMPKSVKDTADYKAVCAAVKENPSLGNYVLVSQSMNDGFDKEMIIACAFKNPEDNSLYVAYRGTGDGKWVDNGIGLGGESSPMQEEANRYYEHLVDDLGLTDYSGDIIVTGHSKGGNEAQFVTLNSEYGYLIDKCYSLDGQGFSESAIKRFKELYGEEYYKEQLYKMYSINGENDYVHDLGITVIPEDHTYFIKTPNANDMGGYHDIKNMIDGASLNWFEDSSGNIVKGEQGYIGELAKEISERLMKMDPDNIKACAVAVMSILEMTLSYDGVMGGEYLTGSANGEFATPEDLFGMFIYGGPMVFETLIESKAGREFLFKTLSNIYKDNFFVGLGVTLIGIPLLGLGYFGFKTLGFVVDVIDMAKEIIDKIKGIGNDIKNFINDVKECVIDIYNKGKNWFNENFNSGYKQATKHPSFRLNTEKMRTYSERLNNVNSRILKVDKRLDSLYWQVGLLDLWNLMQADLLTGYSVRVRACANALKNTADDYEKTENKIKNTL